jgi:hypothetical protein
LYADNQNLQSLVLAEFDKQLHDAKHHTVDIGSFHFPGYDGRNKGRHEDGEAAFPYILDEVAETYQR